MQKITPFLWFDRQAEEAANFYVEIFSARDGNSKIDGITRYGEEGAEASGRIGHDGGVSTGGPAIRGLKRWTSFPVQRSHIVRSQL